MKTLAIQFRYLGDAVLMTPALRALSEQFPSDELHVLVAQEVAPLLEHLPWLKRVWAFPRRRGRMNLKETWPVIRALRHEQFDRSVDFGGSDRGAIVSRLCGARQRLGPSVRRGFWGRRLCYTQTVDPVQGEHQCLRNFRLLSAWGILVPERAELEIRADPAMANRAEGIFARPAILCHLATSQPKKEWPVSHWAEFYWRAAAAGLEVVFCTGIAPRELALLEDLKKLAPEAPCLPAVPELALFLAALKRARLFVSGDTGPLHFAAGLGVPTIALFGPSSARLWAPFGPQHQVLEAGKCGCGGDTAICLSPSPCMAAIAPETVFGLALKALALIKAE